MTVGHLQEDDVIKLNSILLVISAKELIISQQFGGLKH